MIKAITRQLQPLETASSANLVGQARWRPPLQLNFPRKFRILQGAQNTHDSFPDSTLGGHIRLYPGMFPDYHLAICFLEAATTTSLPSGQ